MNVRTPHVRYICSGNRFTTGSTETAKWTNLYRNKRAYMTEANIYGFVRVRPVGITIWLMILKSPSYTPRRVILHFFRGRGRLRIFFLMVGIWEVKIGSIDNNSKWEKKRFIRRAFYKTTALISKLNTNHHFSPRVGTKIDIFNLVARNPIVQQSLQ